MNQYDWDLFVSYASPDNGLPKPLDRWVSRFVQAIESILAARLGRAPKVYFDQTTAQPNQPFARIDSACRTSKLFLAILSPSYLARESGWPLRELEAFVGDDDDTDRLFVVQTTHMDDPGHPKLRERTFKRFFQPASGSRRAMPLVPDEDEFTCRIWDLCDAMVAQLHAMKDETIRPAKAKPRLGPVLLAQVTDDLDDERRAVRRYLEQFGIEVVPSMDYPGGGAEFRRAFADDLSRSKLVVQLLGPLPGRRPPDLPEGYVQHQHQAALAAGVPIMQWHSAALSLDAVTDPGHRAILLGETVTASTLEQFKRDVRARIETPPRSAKRAETPAGTAQTIVFVNAERSDLPVAKRIMEELGDDYIVLIPNYNAPGSNQKDVRKKLSSCNALLLVYGQAGPGWIDDAMLHAVKIRRGRLPFGAICLGPPPHKPNVNFRVPGIRELDCTTAAGDDWQLDPVKELMADRPC